MKSTDEITHNGKTLTEILTLHRMWVHNENGGIKANLSEADLSEADLSGADLSGADLSDANLSEADLSDANLSEADLSWAKFVYNGIEAKRFNVFNNLYKYCVYAILSTDGVQHVRLGCKFYSREDWLYGKGDNNSEFPDDGSESSELRKFALATAFAWLDVIAAQEA